MEKRIPSFSYFIGSNIKKRGRLYMKAPKAFLKIAFSVINKKLD